MVSTLSDCLAELRQVLTAEQIKSITSMDRDGLASLHFSLGMWIRNRWVHEESPIVDRIRDAGGCVFEGDEFSSLIVDLLWHELHRQAFDPLKSHQLHTLAGYGSEPLRIWEAINRSEE